jgi:hypothetical protein
MKGYRCLTLVFLLLAILVLCLPAQASHGSQSVVSSPMNELGAEASRSIVLPDGTTTEYPGKAFGIDTGSSVSSPSVVQGEPEVTTLGNAQSRPETVDKTEPVMQMNTITGSLPLTGLSGDRSGKSVTSNNGGTVNGRDTGSPMETGRENTAGIPDMQGQSKESGRMADMILSSIGIAVGQSGSTNDNIFSPRPGSNRRSQPQQQQHGPPAHASYPCGPAQASPLPPASSQTRDESKEDSPSRQRFKRIGFPSLLAGPIVPDHPSSSFTPQLLFPLKMLLFGGYRRISKKNVLDHNARHVIYRTITATPGIDVKTLADVTGINENTLRYHLDRLVATGKISCYARPGVVRYFQNQGAYSQYEHQLFHYLWTDTPRGIIWLLFQDPGLTRQHIADTLAISGPSVTRQMDNLIADGIVENRFPGRSNHYYLTGEAALTIDKVISQAPVMIHSGIEARTLSATAG